MRNIKKNKNLGGKNNETLARELYKRLRSIDTRKKSEGELRQIIDDFVMDNNLKIQIEYKDFSGRGKKEDDEETDME